MYGDMLFIAAKFKKREVLSSAGNFIKKKKKTCIFKESVQHKYKSTT